MRRRLVAGFVLVAAGGAATVLVVALVSGLRSGDDATGPRPGSTAPPRAWRIEYRVTAGGAEATDVVTVRRPFESRVETTAGGRRSVQVSAFARLRQEGGGAPPSVLAVPPGPAASDVRLDAVLAAAVDAGHVVARGEREVAGRRCDVYRSGTLLTAGVLSPPHPDGGEYADTCVDDVGLVLEEELVIDGEVALRRTALRVALDPDPGAGAFETGEPTVTAADGGGSVLPLVAGSGRPGRFWVLEDPPAGFESCGRFSVVPAQPADAGDDRVASVAEVFVRGRDVLVVDQGATLGGGSPFDLGAGEAADLGPLGAGEVVLGPQASEARTILDEGGYVRVVGTLPPAELVGIAGRLVERDGGDELRVLPDAEPVCRP